MTIYGLFNGPVVVAMSENLTEVNDKKLGEHPRIRPFLTIAVKSCDETHYRPLDSEEIKELLAEEAEIKEPVRQEKPERTARDVANEILANVYPPKIPPYSAEGSESMTCSHCGEDIKGIHVYLEVHDMGKQSEWDSKLPQPRTPYLCIPCLKEFKRVNNNREYNLTDFMEVK